MEKTLQITPVGNLGNQMFQLMIAQSFAQRISGLRISGYNMPEWNLVAPPETNKFCRELVLKGQYVDFESIVKLFDRDWITHINFSALGFRMSHYLPRSYYRNLFSSGVNSSFVFDENTLLVNVRGAEILGNIHRDYGPMPIAFYKHVIETTGLTPVFMGQIANDHYSEALKRSFPRAEFIPSQGPMVDFAMIRSANNIVVSVSTFSWLAAWLSDAKRIHFPIRGIFNPLQRPVIDLLPVEDSRYRFYSFEPPFADTASNQVVDYYQENLTFPILAVGEVRELLTIAQGVIRKRVGAYRRRLKIRAFMQRTFGMGSEIKLAPPPSK